MTKTPQELREAFWKEDAERGSVIRSQYDEIKRVLAEDDIAWVNQKYREIKQHAIDTTEFYQNYSVNDDFPVVNKTEIMASYEKHKAKSGYEGPIHISSTSGSTGTPFSVLQDYPKRMRNIADLKVFGERCDYPSHERMVFFRVLSDKLVRTPEQEQRENIYYVDSSNLSNAHLEKMMKVLLEKKPHIIFSYASTLVALAKYIQTIDKLANDFEITAALTAGESITEEDRKLLENVFGCRAYRRYSDMELGILGQDMGDGGIYHLNYGSYYFECLKQDSDEVAEDGEIGRIVITDLFNKAFPMIRYDTGDLGIMEKLSNQQFPVLKEIYGRKRDCVYATDGGLVSPAKISVSMWGAEGISQWQFIQDTKYQYTLKLNCDGEVQIDSILQKLKGALGDDAEIRIEYVNEIPVLASNKRRAVVCNYVKED